MSKKVCEPKIIAGQQYPTEAQLRYIRKYNSFDHCGNKLESWDTLMKFVMDIWHWENGAKRIGKHKYRFATGGWSGNESIISALCGNQLFWSICWIKSERGGLFIFQTPSLNKDVPDNFDDMDCPTPCPYCGEWCELKKMVIYQEEFLICKKCFNEIADDNKDLDDMIAEDI